MQATPSMWKLLFETGWKRPGKFTTSVAAKRYRVS